ncbi:MAG: hypothetical protein K5928_00920 [Prevotella sp.]|jgi:hypothetical protein|nr:hypothetical protein [Prevotella sp.]
MLPTKETTPAPRTYLTLDDLQARRAELDVEIAEQDRRFTALWQSLFVKREETTRTEFIGSMITHGITAFDTFMLVRKLYKTYRGVFPHAGRKKR